MCGRVRQARSLSEYQEHFGWNPHTALDTEGLKYNVPPGTRPIVFHRIGNGAEQADRLFWGYKPPWYQRGPASNARLDTILKGSGFWKPLLAHRVIMPVDGWYEWTGEKGDKQPWFISARDGAPILMAGIAAWEPGKDILAETGFAIVTDDSAGGMVDIHDRRPICLTVENAREWVNPAVTTKDALELLSTPRPESAFRWWQVTKSMSNSKYQQEDASEPLKRLH